MTPPSDLAGPIRRARAAPTARLNPQDLSALRATTPALVPAAPTGLRGMLARTGQRLGTRLLAIVANHAAR